MYVHISLSLYIYITSLTFVHITCQFSVCSLLFLTSMRVAKQYVSTGTRGQDSPTLKILYFHSRVKKIQNDIYFLCNCVNSQTDKMKLIILKFHIFYTYFTIKKILEVNKKQNKNLKQIRIIYNLTGKL